MLLLIEAVRMEVGGHHSRRPKNGKDTVLEIRFICK
jgi:hypothetical protein